MRLFPHGVIAHRHSSCFDSFTLSFWREQGTYVSGEHAPISEPLLECMRELFPPGWAKRPPRRDHSMIDDVKKVLVALYDGGEQGLHGKLSPEMALEHIHQLTLHTDCAWSEEQVPDVDAVRIFYNGLTTKKKKRAKETLQQSSAEAGESVDLGAGAQPSPQACGRGRKRKSAVPANVVGEGSTSAGWSERAEPQPKSVGEGASAPTKRPRGRPRKNQSDLYVEQHQL